MDGKELLPYVLTVGAMIVLVTVAGVVLYIIRGRLFAPSGTKDVNPGGVLETMRAMRDRGEVSEEEYRAAQAAIVAKATAKKADSGGARPGSNPTKNRTTAGAHDELRARPGFDLTGEPLPPGFQGAAGDESTESG